MSTSFLYHGFGLVGYNYTRTSYTGGRIILRSHIKGPMSLPKKEFMEEALSIWQKEGLPPLKLKEPWYSYEMGYWPKDFAEAADRAVKGEYYKTSEMRAKNRVKVR